MIMRKLVGILVAILVAGGIWIQAAEKQEFEAAKQEYEQSSHDEAARVAYVSKLAKIADHIIPGKTLAVLNLDFARKKKQEMEINKR